jgi:photosystem II stability/assembly factor-like uncharacterized protein
MRNKFHTKAICFIIGILLFQTLYSQNEAANWLFGDFGLEFQHDTVFVENDYAPHENRGEGIISDKNGNLLFYSDGFSVWNKNHEQMPNGFELISKDRSLIHESIIIPQPNSKSVFYIFTVEPESTIYYVEPDSAEITSGLYFSIIDLNLNNGLGDVTTKGVKLLNSTSNKVTAVFHKNGKDVWLITHRFNTNNYYAYLVTASGISESPVISTVGNSSSYDGQLKASPDGKRVACSYDGWSQTRDDFDIFDFNASTGELINPMSFELPVTYRGADGLEFSSDATKLFVIQTGSTGESGLHQYDITGESYDEIRNSRILIDRENFNGYTKMQLAPNGKIYITKGGGGGGTEHLGVIENPNEYGGDCIVNENGLYLEGGSSFVAKTPNFIQSYFFKPNFTFDNNCQAADINFHLTNDFNLDSIRWYFGEGSTSNLFNPVFQFSNAGEYTIQMIAYYPEKTDTIIKNITINPFTEFNLGYDSAVCWGSELKVPDKFNAYLWNTGAETRKINVLEERMYKVTVKNSYGCYSSDSIFLNIIELPDINLPDTIVLGDLDSIQLFPGNFNNYSWNTGETTPSIYAKEIGWYSVYVENNSSCSSTQSVYVASGLDPSEEEQSDWYLLNPRPSLLTGRDISFVNDKIGFIINGGDLLKTNDCGETWNIVLKIANANRIAFKNSMGYIIGNQGQIYKSTHMGGGWNKLSNSFTDHLNAISLIHQDTVLITSDNNLYVSNDGGQTWETRNVENVDIEDSYFTSPLVGHIACRNGKILKTINGGESWYITESVSSFPSDFFTIYFVTDSIGFATREHDDVLKTTNGGETWEELSGYYDAYYDFYFTDQFTGYAVGEYGVIYKTTDGGNSWIWSGFQNGRYGGSSLYGVSFIDENTGFAVGMRGVIVKTIDGGSSWTTYSPTYVDIKQLDFITSEIAYALIGNDLFKTINSGKEWTNIGRPIPEEKTIQFSFIDENIGYVIAGGDVGTSAPSDKVYKTVDGGSNWFPTNDYFEGYFTDDFYSIAFVNEDLGFVSGGYNGNSVFRTKNGGDSWERIESICFGKIQFLDSLNGYAVKIFNAFYRIYKTADGGDTWTVAFEIEEDINSFHFIDKDNGYIIGDNSLMYKTVDGGESWQEVEIPYEYYVNVRFYSKNVGYIFDEEGNLYQTQNGGASWNKLLKQYGLRNIEIENKDIYISGTNGVIMKGKIDVDSIIFHLYPVEELSNTSAMLSGNITSNEANITNVYFEYGKNYTFDHAIKTVPDFVSSNSSQNVNVAISELEANSTYQYRLKVDYQDTTMVSSILSFTTLSNYEITMNYPYSQFSDQIHLSGKILSRGNNITEVEFQYTKDTVFMGASATPSNVPGDSSFFVEADITGLQAETNYVVRLKAKYDNDIIFSSKYNFVTLSSYEISLYRPYINGNNVTLAGVISSHQDTIRNIGFEYGTSRAYSTYVECENNTINPGESVQVQVELLNMNPDSVYFYRLRAETDTSIIYSDENILSMKSEVTLVPIEVEELPDSTLRLNAFIQTYGMYLQDIQFRYGTTTELYDSVFANPSYAMGYQTFHVSAPLNGLTPDTEYYFKLRGTYNNEYIYSDQFSYVINRQTASNKWFLAPDIEFYPNPTNDNVTIRSSAKINRIELINSEGKLLKTMQNTNTINMTNFPSGVYLVKAFIGKRFIAKKIVRL